MTFKVLITGSRYWKTDDHIIKIFNEFKKLLIRFSCNPCEVIIIHGDAPGVDSISEAISQCYGFKTIPYPCDWSFGKIGGRLRNQKMYDLENPFDFCLAFHDDINASKGTKHMVSIIKNLAPTTPVKIIP